MTNKNLTKPPKLRFGKVIAEKSFVKLMKKKVETAYL